MVTHILVWLVWHHFLLEKCHIFKWFYQEKFLKWRKLNGMCWCLTGIPQMRHKCTNMHVELHLVKSDHIFVLEFTDTWSSLVSIDHDWSWPEWTNYNHVQLVSWSLYPSSSKHRQWTQTSLYQLACVTLAKVMAIGPSSSSILCWFREKLLLIFHRCVASKMWF